MITRSILARLVGSLVATMAIATLPGCFSFNLFGQSSQPPVPSFSYYSMVSFTKQRNFCVDSTDVNNPTCFYQVNSLLGQPLINAGWTPRNELTDGEFNNAWTTAIQGSQIIGDKGNLVYFDTHGIVDQVNHVSMLCLRDCDGVNIGGQVSITSNLIGNAWNGPNWLILDSCEVTQPNVGWESIFGGNLHGIMGWNDSVYGDDPSTGSDFLQALTNDLTTSANAYNVWLDAINASAQANFGSMLLPQANRWDKIEAAGGGG